MARVAAEEGVDVEAREGRGDVTSGVFARALFGRDFLDVAGFLDGVEEGLYRFEEFRRGL